MQNKVWVWHGSGTLRLEARQMPEPGPNEVLLAVRAVGICSTDLHVLQGKIKLTDPPHIMGHEGAGDVVEVGPGVPKDWVGRRCTVDTVVGCGQCRFCLSGRKHLCHSVQEIGQTIPGLWARYVVVPVENLVPIPGHVSYAAATQMETLHCVLGGMDRIRPQSGESAIVLGCGATGILFARLLRLQGMNRLVVTGTRESRLHMAQQFGADQIVNVRKVNLAETLRGERFDMVIETVGGGETIRIASTLAECGGRVLLFGIPAGRYAEVDVLDAIWREITFIATGNAPQVWPRVAALVASREVDLEALISYRFPFEMLDEAVLFAQGHREECIKAVVEINESTI